MAILPWPAQVNHRAIRQLSHFSDDKTAQWHKQRNWRHRRRLDRQETPLDEGGADRIILGPSGENGLAAPTVRRLLTQQGMPVLAGRVYQSTTPFPMIWFSVSQARANASSDTCFQECGLAARARQSNDFG
jgi:hypothetical protein